jgi:chorismate mutase
MNLASLLETEDTRIAAIKLKIAKLKDERRQLVQQFAGSGFQSGINPIYAPRINRLDAQLKVAGQELTAALERPNIEQSLIAAAQKASAQPAPTHGERVKQGMERWTTLAREHGNEAGLNQHIEQLAKQQTQNGRYFLDIKQLATDLDVGENTLRRRLEQTGLNHLLAWLPNAVAGVNPSAVVRAKNIKKYS